MFKYTISMKKILHVFTAILKECTEYHIPVLNINTSPNIKVLKYQLKSLLITGRSFMMSGNNVTHEPLV